MKEKAYYFKEVRVKEGKTVAVRSIGFLDF